MKRILAAVLILSIIPSCCYRRGTVAYYDRYDVAAIVQVSVPYAYSTDTLWDDVELLETDQYGRTLYHYRSYYNEIYIVCQKTSHPNAYYYEDYCYLVHPRNDKEFTADEILWLKEANDWNLPLDENKMRAVNYEESVPELSNESNMREVVRTALGVGTENVGIGMDELETDRNGYTLIFVRVSDISEKRPDEDYPHETFLVLYRKYPSAKVIAYEQIPNGYDFRDDIIAFKDKYCR